MLGDFVSVGAFSTVGAGTYIGPYSKVGNRVKIGPGCSMTAFCEVRDRCILGDRITMGSRCTLSAGTVVEDDVIIKYQFVVTDTPVLLENGTETVGRLGRGSRFGAGEIIMPGVSIGENAEIGASSQVRHNVPANEVWYGIPAKFHRKIDPGQR